MDKRRRILLVYFACIILATLTTMFPRRQRVTHCPNGECYEEIEFEESAPESTSENFTEQSTTRQRDPKDYFGDPDPCNSNNIGTPGKYFDVIFKDFDCQNLFGNSSDFKFSQTTEKLSLLDHFTYGGRIPVDNSSAEIPDPHGMNQTIKWNCSKITKWRYEIRNGNLFFDGLFQMESKTRLMRALKNHSGPRDNALVLGASRRPWIQALALETGFRTVWTLDDNPIFCDHGQIKTLQPADMVAAFLNGSLPQFDAVLSFSSLEHQGLGHHGDPVSPHGDLIAMARAWCVTRPGGVAVISVPAGNDTICANALRLYGKLQFAHLFANWEQVDSNVDTGVFQLKGGNRTCRDRWNYRPVNVLRKPNVRPKDDDY